MTLNYHGESASIAEIFNRLLLPRDAEGYGTSRVVDPCDHAAPDHAAPTRHVHAGVGPLAQNAVIR
jgi:hypothetical protein